MKFIVSCQIGLAASVFSAWTPPIGIPAPAFGINETAPALPNPWTGNVKGFYYVQSGGSNSGNGYPGNASNEIPSSLPAGSVVIVNGTFTTSYRSHAIDCQGTAAAPVFIKGASATTRAVATKQWDVGGSYFIVEYVDFLWSDAEGAFNFGDDHGVLRHCTLRGSLNAGYTFFVGDSMVYWDNHVFNMGNWQNTGDRDYHGLVIGSGTSYAWIVDNEFDHCEGDGVQLNAGSIDEQATLHHIYLGRNHCHHNKQMGLWTKQAVDVIFSQNMIHDMRPSTSGGGGAMGGQYGPGYVWFLFNHLYDCESGIRIESRSDGGTGTTGFVIGNLIHDITNSEAGDPGNPHASGCVVNRGLENFDCIHNTLWNYQAGIMSPGSGGHMNIENNIFGARNVAQGFDLYLEVASYTSASNMRNNLFPSACRIQWPQGSVYSTVAAFQSGTGKGQGCVAGTPVFANLTGDDYRLNSGSPGINAGAISTDAYAIFQSRYGIDIRKDFNGAPRPNGAWDIGAFEYSGTGKETALTLPRTIELVVSPNPFYAGTVFILAPARAGVSGAIEIFSSEGRLIRRLKAGLSGERTVWDGRDETGREAACGTYMFSMQAGKKRFQAAGVLMR